MNTPTEKMFTAIVSRDLATVKRLLEQGTSPDALDIEGESALMQACMGDTADVRLVELLLSYGADPHLSINGGLNALLVASGYGHVAIARLLLDCHANPNQETVYGTPLLVAVAKGHSGIVSLLIKAGASVDDTSSLNKDFHVPYWAAGRPPRC